MVSLHVLWIFIFVTAWSSASCFTDPHCRGTTNAIVYLFEWTWVDIERECPQLAQAGYCGIQVPIPTEHWVNSGQWWERIHPVSYNLESMSGTEAEFRKMVSSCEHLGIRVFVTLELNHMSDGVGLGFNGTYHNGLLLDYPGVPYTSDVFHGKKDCAGGRMGENSPAADIQGCVMSGPDLDQSNPLVRVIMANLLDKLLDIGVSGFFLYDAYYIAPSDIEGLLRETRTVQSGKIPFVGHNVYTTLENNPVDPAQFYPLGRVTDFTLSEVLGRSLLTDRNLTELCSVSSYRTLVPRDNAVVFVDDPSYQRGANPRGGDTVTFKNHTLYELAQSFVLATGFGMTRVMSSYKVTDGFDGRPKEAVKLRPHGACGSRWVCEHRWPVIEKMVQFSNRLHKDLPVMDCVSTEDSVTFKRGDNTYYWSSLHPLDTRAVTSDLPPGRYRDLISDQVGTVFDHHGRSTFDFSGQNIAALIFLGRSTTTPPPMTTAQPTTTPPPPTTPSTTTTTPTTPSPSPTTTTTTTTTTTPTTPPPPPTTTTTTTTTTSTTTTTTTPTTTTPTTTTTTTTTSTPTTTTPSTTTTTTPTTTTPTTTTPTTTTPTTTTPTTTTPTTTTPAPTLSPWKRTIIFIKKQTQVDDYVFIRGGSPSKASGNGNEEHAIPIRHRKLQTKSGTPPYDTWAHGDNFLDWNGREETQTWTYNGILAAGSPMQWTSNQLNDDYYTIVNRYGPHLWMTDIDMNCDYATNGFFEVKGYTYGYWEQGYFGKTCKGGANIPWTSHNHMAMCGKINVFTWEEEDCMIEDTP